MSGRLRSIDALRGVAVIAVIVSHLPFSWRGQQALAVAQNFVDATYWGHLGVHLFLVISGFCIHRRWATNSHRVDLRAFWARRLHRLYPPYAIALILPIAGAYVITRRLPGIVDVSVMLLMLQNVTGAAVRVGNGPMWSLALEEQLYALYWPLLWLRARFGWLRCLLVVVAVVMAWRVAGLWLSGDAQVHWYTVGPSRWFEWALGAVAAEASTGRVTLPRWMSSRPLAIALPLALVVLDITFDPIWGVVFFVWINALVKIENVPGWLARVGMFSYSVYLTHIPVMNVTKVVVERLGAHDVALVLAVRLLVPFAFGYAFFRIVESRFLNAPATKEKSQPIPEGMAGEES